MEHLFINKPSLPTMALSYRVESQITSVMIYGTLSRRTPSLLFFGWEAELGGCWVQILIIVSTDRFLILVLVSVVLRMMGFIK